MIRLPPAAMAMLLQLLSTIASTQTGQRMIFEDKELLQSLVLLIQCTPANSHGMLLATQAAIAIFENLLCEEDNVAALIADAGLVPALLGITSMEGMPSWVSSRAANALASICKVISGRTALLAIADSIHRFRLVLLRSDSRPLSAAICEVLHRYLRIRSFFFSLWAYPGATRNRGFVCHSLLI
jgi:hypothetical protein